MTIRGTITIREMTTDEDRARGLRSIVVAREGDDTSAFAAITVSRTENLSLYDEAPSFGILPYAVEANVSLAALLVKLAGALIEHPGLSHLSDETLPHLVPA